MNKDILSGVVGAGFFGIGYLALALPLAPALAIGGAAFVASELVINGNKKIQEKVGLSKIWKFRQIKSLSLIIV